MSSNPVTRASDVETEAFPWGGIKWVAGNKIHPYAEQTLGLVFINPGEQNPVHYHPNCEELLYVISGECDHRFGDESFHMEAGDTIRIPIGVMHNASNNGWEPVRMLVSFSNGDRQTVMVDE